MPWNLVGHDWAVRLLQGHLQHDRVRHAYLFTGPTGVGRRTLALRFAQALLCSQPPAPGEFCGDCRDCRLVERMEHPDLAIVQAEGESGVLKVDQVRLLQRTLSLTAYQARYRVALMLRFEQANPSAANALLKTLEEPPPHVILLLTASNAEALLPTIVSRCEVLRLQQLPAEEVRADLQRTAGLPEDQARLIAHLSGGRIGIARRLAEDPARLAQRTAWLDDQIRLLSANRVERFAYAERLVRDKAALQGALQAWLSLWHDVLLRRAGAAVPLANQDRASEIEALAARLDLVEARRTVASLDRTLSLVEGNVNSRLAVEVLMLDLPRV